MQTLQNKDTTKNDPTKKGWTQMKPEKMEQKTTGKDDTKTKADDSKNHPSQKSGNTK